MKLSYLKSSESSWNRCQDSKEGKFYIWGNQWNILGKMYFYVNTKSKIKRSQWYIRADKVLWQYDETFLLLTLFKMAFLGLLTDRVQLKRYNQLKSVIHIPQWWNMVYLWYLSKTSIKLRNRPGELCWHQHLSSERRNFCYITK